FAELGKLLVRRGFRIALLGGNSDADICRQLAECIGSGTANLADRTALLESCELLKRCSLVISNDSGVQHLAAAVGTPCISLFSCRSLRGQWWRYGAKNVVLGRGAPCHTCYLEVRPYDNHCKRLSGVCGVGECFEGKLGEGTLAFQLST